VNLAPSFRLGGPPIDTECRSGFQLKAVEPLDPRLMRIAINSGLQAYLRPVNAWATAKMQLYPSRENMNFALDKVNKKLSCEFYLDNQLEETVSVLEVDGDSNPAGFWSSTGTPILSNETTMVIRGTKSLKCNYNNAPQYGGFQHTYGSGQNWSAYDFVAFWWCGANSGLSWLFRIQSSSGNLRGYQFTENWTGWKRVVVPILTMTPTGTLDLTSVTFLSFSVQTASPPTNIIYLDRMVLDIGQWVKVEVAIPDYLIVSSNVAFSSWHPSSYDAPFLFYPVNGAANASGTNYNMGRLYALTGTSHSTIYGGKNLTDLYLYGNNGVTKGYLTAMGPDSSLPTTITYVVKGGTKKRVGFILKLPPSDLQQSSSYGISQCRLKLEVYYV
jgi:hypothetical protein